MARVEGDFQSEVIRAYKGVLDFYYWRGIGVVRGWPRKPVLPRNPAVQAAGVDFRDNSRAISALPLELQVLTAEEVKDTAYTWKDAWTTTVYGHGLDWQPANKRPPQDPRNLLVMKVDLFHSPAGTGVVWNVNSAAYITDDSKKFVVPFSVVPFTHYKIWGRNGSTQVGQTVSVQLATAAAPATPTHSPGNDAVFTNAFNTVDTGWLSIDNIPAVDTLMCLAFKGSNVTVDITLQALEVTFAII